MIASILTIPQSLDTKADDLFRRFVRDADGIVDAYQLETESEIAVVSIWVSEAKRQAYMGSQLAADVAKAYPQGTRRLYSVRNVK